MFTNTSDAPEMVTDTGKEGEKLRLTANQQWCKMKSHVPPKNTFY
jgi:hypothetical protein